MVHKVCPLLLNKEYLDFITLGERVNVLLSFGAKVKCKLIHFQRLVENFA